MNTPLDLDRAMIDALGWTLVHFVWQGVLIAGVFAVLDRTLSRATAGVRYLVACAALGVMLVAAMVTFTVVRGFDRAAATPHVPAATTADVPAVAQGTTSEPASTAWSAPSRALESLRSSRVTALFPWLVACWSLGVLAFSLRLLGSWWLVRRLQRSLGNLALPEWNARLRSLAGRLGIARPVRLFRSTMVQVPTAVGWLQPVILLPASTLTGLSVAQIESVLAHELAHVRRHDYLVNLLQSLVETLLFYHPAVWWVSRRIREERELCCDDIAVGVAGDPIVYAEALCRLERLRGQARALAMAASGGSLLSRIRRLLGNPVAGHDHGARGLAVLLAATAVIAVVSGTQSRGAPAAVPGSHASDIAAIRSTIAQVVGAPAPATTAIQAALPLPQVAVATLSPPAIIALPIAGAIPRLMVTAPAPMAQPVVWAGDIDDGAAARADTEERPGSRSQYTVDEWIELARHGIDPRMAARFASVMGGRLKVETLVALVDHGVSPEYVVQVRRGPLAGIGARDLIRLVQHGVPPDYVDGLGDMGADITADDLINLTQHGITSDWFAAMRWMGYPGFSVERAIRLADLGVTPEFASQLKIVGRRRFSLDELEQLRTQGVTTDFVAQMGRSLSGVTCRDLIRLRQQGVTPSYAAKMRIVGRFDAAQLVALRQQGVEPEFAFSLSAAGYNDLTVENLIALRQQGVDAEFVSGLIAVGYRGLSTDDLIRLRQNGVDGAFIAEVRRAGYPTPSVSQIIRLRQEGLPTGGR